MIFGLGVFVGFMISYIISGVVFLLIKRGSKIDRYRVK